MAVARTRSRRVSSPSRLLARYLRESSDFATGFLFILPLLVGYEVGLALLRSDVVNLAGGVIRLVFHLFGPAEPVVFAALTACLVVVALRRAERMRLDAELFGVMFLESLAYAFVLGLVCVFVARRLTAMAMPPGATLAEKVVLSVGAGVYEEVVFRVVVLGALYYGLKATGRVKPSVAALVAIVVSSAAFSLCHHIGPYGDPLEVGRVVYRFAVGLFFAAIYIYRGLGIVVYAHALYDIFASLAR